MITDFRDITHGTNIPSFAYADQPEIVAAPDGALVCAVTTALGSEGAGSTFVGISRSTDGGKSWSPLQRIDDCPYESSYSTLAVTDYGRIYCFYNLNDEGFTDDDVFTEPDGTRAKLFRYDMGFGIFCFRYSDDSGKSWSEKRYSVPMRLFDIDLDNPLTCRGKHRYLFWNVSKPFFHGGRFYHAMIKFQYKHGDFMYRSEGALLVSDNLAYERDPAKIRWETLPEGTKGIAAPEGGGLVAEEQCFVPLDDGTLFCVFRTVSGHPGCTYSSDGGRTWEKSDFLRYPDGRPVKHVRAANFVWKCGKGRYLYWFHNNGGKSWDGRNPAWVLAGHEIDTDKGRRIAWSQPEILLYDPNAANGISYPDMLLYDGRYFVSETQKSVTRLHEIPTPFLESLWQGKTLPDKVCTLLPAPAPQPPEASRTALWNGARLTLVLDAEFDGIPAQTVLFDTADGMANAAGLRVETDESGAVCVVFGSGTQSERAVLQREYLLGARRQLAVTLDRGANIVHASSDGVFLDGGDELRYGWKRFDGGIPEIEAAQIRLNGAFVHSVTLFG